MSLQLTKLIEVEELENKEEAVVEAMVKEEIGAKVVEVGVENAAEEDKEIITPTHIIP